MMILHRIIRYLEDTIRTSVPLIPDPDIDVPSDEFEASQVRGLNKGLLYQPDENEQQKDLHNVVERCQHHVHNATCYKYWKGPPDKKICCFELDVDNVIQDTIIDGSTGEITYQHLDGMINNFNSIIIEAL